MKCECCGEELGGDKNYVLYALRGEARHVRLCKACMMLGMRAPSGSIIADKEVIDPPKLAFPFKSNRAEYCKVAREEGWLTNSLPGNAVVIDTHYEQALVNNYFDGLQWRKNLAKTSVECFRRSCKNIKEFYPQWLVLNTGTR